MSAEDMKIMAIALLDRIGDAEGSVIYVDPPYLEKGAKYLHDFTPDSHARLAASLSRFKRTRVVVSYYEHPDLVTLYHGWTKRDCSTVKRMTNQAAGETGAAVAPEVLLINGPSYGVLQ